MITIFPCGSRKSKRVPSGRDVFLRLLVGELGTPKLARIFAYGKSLYSCRMLLHGASDPDQRCLETRNSEDGCTFPPNTFAPIPKITQKLHFVGPLNAKPIILSHVNGATKVKLYNYMGIGKYLRCVKLSARGRPEGAGPLNVNLGLPDISETTKAKKLNLKIPLNVVKYPLWVQKLLYYIRYNSRAAAIDFRRMSVSPGQTNCKTVFSLQ